MKYKGREREYKLEHQRQYRNKHREEYNMKAREYRKKRMNDPEFRRKCREWNKRATDKFAKNHPEKKKMYQRKYYNENKETIMIKNRNHHKEIRKKIREEIIKLLGGKCSNPYNINHGDFTQDIRCLQIDHVNGGGTKKRKNMNHSAYEKMVLEQIKADSKDYQLLCANCNWIKRCENSETGSRWVKKYEKKEI